METIMIENAAGALKFMLDCRDTDRVLVITDQATKEVGDTFAEAARGIAGFVQTYVLPEDKRPLTAVPDDLSPLIKDIDIALTLFSARSEETPFRIELIHGLMEVVRKLGHGPGITASMLKDGPLAVDYNHMVKSAKYLMDRFDGAVSVHITAPGGTDITLNIGGRDFATDVFIEDGKWGNIPGGEIWCAPLEDEANGTLVCDGSIGDLGKVPAPVKIEVKGGHVESVECSDKAFGKRVEEVLSIDDMSKTIGELGIGLNPGAKLTGNLLEDEKAFHTAHIAFGNNLDMPGGRNSSQTHRDFLFKDPTFYVTFEDGRIEQPIIDGQIIQIQQPRESDAKAGYKRIMVAMDFSEQSIEALKKGHALAESFNSTLIVCHVVPRTVSVNPLFPQYSVLESQDMDSNRVERAMDALNKVVQEHTGRTSEEFMPIISNGQPASEAVRVAEDQDADLIIVAHRGASGLARMLLGSVAESIARHAHCSVLVVR